jgi:hypothetical protein
MKTTFALGLGHQNADLNHVLLDVLRQIEPREIGGEVVTVAVVGRPERNVFCPEAREDVAADELIELATEGLLQSAGKQDLARK